MATITMVFPDPLNVSLQIGDTAYYVPTNTHGGFLTSLNSGATAEETIVEIGAVASITQNTNTITVTTSLTTANLPTTSHYIFFSKDNKANLSSLLGYYSLLKLRNNSIEKSEIFSVGTDWVESSK